MTEVPTFTLAQLADRPSRAPVETSRGVRRPRILVVDDEPSVTDLLSEVLLEIDSDPVVAHSGRDALDRLASTPVDAVLLDHRMPGMDGLETLRHIRARDPHLPVLMITGHDDPALTRAALELGAFDHILKPLDLGYLTRAVLKMLAASIPEAGRGAATSRRASAPELLYDLALDTVRAARPLKPAAGAALGAALEQIAFMIVQRGSLAEQGAERTELLRAVNGLRTLLRFGRELGDIDDETHRRLESRIVKVRTAMGLG